MIKWILRFILIVFVLLVAALLVAVIVGASLPQKHIAARRVQLNQPPEVVWKVITDPPNWRPQVRSFKEFPLRGSHRLWQETDQYGQTILYEEVEAVPNRRLVTRIADPKLPFGGTWTYEIEPTAQGSALTITENGEVYNPIFRFISQYVIGNTATLDAYTKALKAKLAAAR